MLGQTQELPVIAQMAGDAARAGRPRVWPRARELFRGTADALTIRSDLCHPADRADVI